MAEIGFDGSSYMYVSHSRPTCVQLYLLYELGPQGEM